MYTKVTSFDVSDQEIARFGKALSHPARIRILRYLAECRHCVTGNIVEQLPLSQSTVSQHLRALKEAGLIKGRLEGPATCYCLNEETLHRAGEQFSTLFIMICYNKTNDSEGTCNE
jgi:DNA-binding transcriptional ArsR family regulator